MSDNFTENDKRRSFRVVRLFTIIVVTVFIGWYMIFHFLSARNYAIQINMITDSLFIEKIGKRFAPPSSENFWNTLTEKEKNRAFLNARHEMAQSDSVRMTIHLPDSTLWLEIKGLVVHTVLIRDVKLTASLRQIPPLAKAWWLSSPFKTIEHSSTIPHEPIVIKHAPADTIEAQNSPVLPPEPEDKLVYFTYKTDRNLTLHFNQWEDGNRKGYFCRKMKRELKSFGATLGYMLQFRYKPFEHRIEITLDKKDARTIYRALPEFPKIAVKISD